MTHLLDSFKAARRVSAPLIGIETADAAATVADIRAYLNGSTPTVAWDCVTGLRGLNDLGTDALSGVSLPQTVNFTEALLAAASFPANVVVFCYGAHRHLGDASAVQAVWNLRDTFKLNRRTLVLLGPSFSWPAEIASDVVILDAPKPTRADLAVILDQQHKNAQLDLPSDAVREQALDALTGLDAFPAENVSAMALTKSGIDVTALWDRKIKAINATDGLQVWTGKGERMADLRGLENVAEFFRSLIAARAFDLVVFIDEAEKSFAGATADHVGDSGVSKDQVGKFLSAVEDHDWLGVLLAGVAGTGKTEMAKAVAAEAGVPLVQFDLGGMKGGIVGESERRIRAALKTITAMSTGRVLVILTANKTTTFTPELNRRVPDQFFFDTPTDEARAAIWPVYIAKFELTAAQAVVPVGFDAGWTGAEIKRACKRAALLGTTVVEAGRYIVPQAVSAASTIAALRVEAQGRFLSASEPGLYRAPVATVGQRAITVGIEARLA